MVDALSHLILYKTPSIEIIRHRKEFYGLWKRCDDQTFTWLNRVQNKIDRCEFPPVLSRDYLLVDRFVCALDDDERKFVQSVNTWTLKELQDYFDHRQADTDYGIQSSQTAIDENEQKEMPTFCDVKCEFVSKLNSYKKIFLHIL